MRIRYFDLFNKLMIEDNIKCYRRNTSYYMIPKYWNIFTWPWGYIIKDTFLSLMCRIFRKKNYQWK